MSVGPLPEDSAIVPRHYGSAYTMADYTAKNQNVYVTASFLPVPRLSLSGTVAYSKSTAAYEAVNFDEAEIRSRLDGDFTAHDFDFTDLPDYSRLDYSLIQIRLGLEYRLRRNTVWTADVEVRDLSDDAAVWVYGDETGRMYIVRSGVRFNF